MDQEWYLKKLRNKYDDLNIKTVHKRAANLFQNYHNAHKAFISLLWYVQKQKRWREDPLFVNYSFFEYIKEKFNYTEARYRVECQAIMQFSAQCKKYGIGAVAGVINKVGSLHRANTVFALIAGNEIKNGIQYSYKQILEVATTHARPDLSKKPKGVCKKCVGYKEKIDKLERILGDFRKSEFSLRSSTASKGLEFRKLEQTVADYKLKLQLLEEKNSDLEKFTITSVKIDGKEIVKKDNEVPSDYIESAHNHIDQLSHKLEGKDKEIKEKDRIISTQNVRNQNQRTKNTQLFDMVSDLEKKYSKEHALRKQFETALNKQTDRIIRLMQCNQNLEIIKKDNDNGNKENRIY